MQGRHSIDRQFAEFHRFYIADFRHDIPAYLDLAAKYSGPVLDVGCGTGRVAAHLAAAGHEVHAVDTSRPMLEVAMEHLRPWLTHVQVYDFDLREQPTSTRFPVVLVTLHKFNSLIDVEEQRLFLRHLGESMRSPGILAMDLFCPLSLVKAGAAGTWRCIEREVDGHRLYVRDHREMLTPLLERRTRIFHLDDRPEVELITHRRYLPPSQIFTLLSEAGFESIRMVSGYDLTTVRPIADAESLPGPFMVLAER